MSKISIILVDDHKIFRDGFRLLLDSFSFVQVIGEASNGEELMVLLEDREPNIIFMDINMPKIDGIEATKLALSKYSDMKVIALTTFLEEDYLEKMLLAGVEGYMLKSSELEEFEVAIEKVYLGGNYFSDAIVKLLAGNINKLRDKKLNKKEIEFTKREQEILILICKGFSNKEIAESCFLSPKTVEKHKSSLFYKTSCSNTVNLVIYAFKHKLIEL